MISLKVYTRYRGLSFISNRQRRNEGTFCASGLAGIEPTPPAPEDRVCAPNISIFFSSWKE